MPFSIGILSFILAIILPVVYFVVRKVREFEHWRTNSKEPLERFVPTAFILAILGIILGGFAQPQWEMYSVCMQTGSNFVACLFRSLK